MLVNDVIAATKIRRFVEWIYTEAQLRMVIARHILLRAPSTRKTTIKPNRPRVYQTNPNPEPLTAKITNLYNCPQKGPTHYHLAAIVLIYLSSAPRICARAGRVGESEDR